MFSSEKKISGKHSSNALLRLKVNIIVFTIDKYSHNIYINIINNNIMNKNAAVVFIR